MDSFLTINLFFEKKKLFDVQVAQLSWRLLSSEIILSCHVTTRNDFVFVEETEHIWAVAGSGSDLM